MAIAATPTNFYVQQGNAQVFLSWDLSVGATTYQIQKSTDGITYSNLSAPAVNSYLDTAVVIGTQYFYQIASVNGSGTSAYTAPQSTVPTQAGQLSLGQVRLMSQQRADRVGSNFVTVPEWNTYINQSYFELYDLLTTVYEDYYMATPLTFQVDGVTQLYPLPNGVLYSGARPFYKLLGVDLGLDASTNAFVTLKKFDFISRNRYVYPQITSTFLGVFNLQYRLMDNYLMFIPVPSGGQFVRLWYIPRMNQLLKDTDILDGISGWSEYVITDAAIKALEKEESDTSLLLAQKQALKMRIEETAMNRDAGMPDTISDTRTLADRWGGPNGDGSYGGY